MPVFPKLQEHIGKAKNRIRILSRRCGQWRQGKKSTEKKTASIENDKSFLQSVPSSFRADLLYGSTDSIASKLRAAVLDTHSARDHASACSLLAPSVGCVTVDGCCSGCAESVALSVLPVVTDVAAVASDGSAFPAEVF